MKTKKILKTQGWTVKTWRGMKNMKEKFAVSENWGLCSLWTVFSGKALGYFFLGEKLSANDKPRAVCCHLCLLADGLPPVGLFRWRPTSPYLPANSRSFFLMCPALVSVCNWTVRASMEFGRRRQGGGGGWRNGNTGLYAGWRNRNDRPSNPWKKQEQWPLQKL